LASVPSQPAEGPDLTARLRAGLTAALSARDKTATAALRSALAAIGNAEAVPVPPAAGLPADDGSRAGRAQPDQPRGDSSGGTHVAGSVAGLGATEAARRRLSAAEVEQIVRAEITGRQEAADQYDQAGRADRAEMLRQEAGVLGTIIAS
jgi:hypothetical protein